MQNPAQFTLTFTSTNLFLHFIISTALPDSCGQLLKQTLHHTVKQNKSLLSCERKKKTCSKLVQAHSRNLAPVLPQKLSYSCYTATSGSLLPPKMHGCILSVSLMIHPLCTGSEHRKRLAVFRGEQLEGTPHTPEPFLPCAWTRQRLSATPFPALGEGSPRAG